MFWRFVSQVRHNCYPTLSSSLGLVPILQVIDGIEMMFVDDGGRYSLKLNFTWGLKALIG